MARSEIIFSVSVRLDEETMNKLDFLAEVDGIPRGRFIREALNDYMAGASIQESAAMRCYVEYCSLRSKEKIIARGAFIANWKRTNAQYLRMLKGQKET